MTPPRTEGDASAGRYPQPPFSVDLLADLHAGVLEADVAEHVWARIDDDPSAREILAALDRTLADIGSAPLESVPVPASVHARTEDTLASIRAEVTTANGGNIVGLADTRKQGRARRWALVGMAGAAAIAAVLAISLGITRDPGVAPDLQAGPTTTLDGPGRATALSYLGRSDHAPFGSEAALRACTGANGVAPTTPVLGSGPVAIDGRDGIVILLGTGVAGRFEALVVGTDCAADRPSTISRTIIGG